MDRGLVHTLGGGDFEFVTIMALFVAQKNSDYSQLRVSDYCRSDPL